MHRGDSRRDPGPSGLRDAGGVLVTRVDHAAAGHDAAVLSSARRDDHAHGLFAAAAVDGDEGQESCADEFGE